MLFKTYIIKKFHVFDKIKIGEIFKERFEERTKSYKSLNQQNINYKNNNYQKTLEYQQSDKNKDILKYLSDLPDSDISNKNKNPFKYNNYYRVKQDDSLILCKDQIQQDSIELIESQNDKNNEFILQTFDGDFEFDKYDKKVLVSELDADIINLDNNNNCNKLNLENNLRDFGRNSCKVQKKMSEISFMIRNKINKNFGKNKVIKKKIYPIRKINLYEIIIYLI